MKKLALLCFRKNGHFMHYTKLVWNAYEGTFDITLFTTEEIAQSEEYKCYFGEIDDKLKKVLVKEGTEREAFKRVLERESMITYLGYICKNIGFKSYLSSFFQSSLALISSVLESFVKLLLLTRRII